jgi:hypothetical protein
VLLPGALVINAKDYRAFLTLYCYKCLSYELQTRCVSGQNSACYNPLRVHLFMYQLLSRIQLASRCKLTLIASAACNYTGARVCPCYIAVTSACNVVYYVFSDKVLMLMMSTVTSRANLLLSNIQLGKRAVFSAFV